MKNDTDTAKTVDRLVRSLLRRTSSQGYALLCTTLGRKSHGEHGAAMQRSVVSSLQAVAVKVLHRGLSEEKGNLCSDVSGQDSTPSVFQLHKQDLREDVHCRFIFVYQGSWYSLWHQACYGLLPKGESQLAASVLCNAPGYQGLLYAHRQKQAVGDCHRIIAEDGYSPCQQGFTEDVGRRDRHGLRMLADRGHRSARSEGALHYCRGGIGLDWSRSCKKHEESCGRSWTADRQPYVATVLQCLYESVRPVCETGAEMQELRQICGRRYYRFTRQEMVAESCSRDTAFLERESWSGLASWKVDDKRGASWNRVPRLLYQAIQDVHISKDIGTYRKEDISSRLYESTEGSKICKQLSRYLPTYRILSYSSSPVYEADVPHNRSLRRRYDKTKRQTTVI